MNLSQIPTNDLISELQKRNDEVAIHAWTADDIRSCCEENEIFFDGQLVSQILSRLNRVEAANGISWETILQIISEVS